MLPSLSPCLSSREPRSRPAPRLVTARTAAAPPAASQVAAASEVVAARVPRRVRAPKAPRGPSRAGPTSAKAGEEVHQDQRISPRPKSWKRKRWENDKLFAIYFGPVQHRLAAFLKSKLVWQFYSFTVTTLKGFTTYALFVLAELFNKLDCQAFRFA